jgi:dihydrofolate reductase
LDLPEGVAAAKTPQEALHLAADAQTIMIIGGGQIYKLFEAKASTVHLTQVHATPDGDTSFALSNPDAWQEVARERFSAGENDSADYSFITLQRR